MNLFHRSGRDQTKPDETNDNEKSETNELSAHDKFVEKYRVEYSDEVPDKEKAENKKPESTDSDDDEDIGEHERDLAVERKSKDGDDDEGRIL